MGPKAITPLETWYKSIRSPHEHLFTQKRNCQRESQKVLEIISIMQITLVSDISTAASFNNN